MSEAPSKQPGDIPVEVTCHRCRYSWHYTGKNEWYATCPQCYTKTKVRPGEDKYHPKKKRRMGHNLTEAQYQTLLTTYRLRDQDPIGADIAKKCRFAENTAYVALKDLRKMGLVADYRADFRSKGFVLTRAGKEELELYGELDDGDSVEDVDPRGAADEE